MSENYIKSHFSDIKKYADVIERRIDDSWCTVDSVLEEKARYLEMCRKYDCNYILIDDRYEVEIDL